MLWLPVLLIPQLLFTLGICWFLAALGVYMRDLGQIMALVLTHVVFHHAHLLPESATLSPAIAAVMRQNPLYVLVRGYRAVFLEGHAPELLPLVKLWAIALVAIFPGARLVLSSAEKLRRRDLISAVLESPTRWTIISGIRCKGKS